MKISPANIRVVDGAISLDGTIVHVRCPECGFHHEHDVPLPIKGQSRALYDLGDMKLPDLGVHLSRCVDQPRIIYQVVQTDWLGADQMAQSTKQDAIRAKAVGLRQRREERAARRFQQMWKADAAKRAKSLLRLKDMRRDFLRVIIPS